MKYTNVNSFKEKIKNIAKEKNIPAQQVQQNYLIEQILFLIASSKYKSSFIIKGGYLIGSMIGIDKRTTMDLDVTLKNVALSEEKLFEIFNEILSSNKNNNLPFLFEIDSIKSIRKDDDYGGYQVKIRAAFDALKEVVFVDVTTGDKITPNEIQLNMTSVFSEEKINILSYNLETVLAEKLEAVITRGAGATRPRDRYDLVTIWKLRKHEINHDNLKKALINTSAKRKSIHLVQDWREQVNKISMSDYQKQLWTKYQKSFKYAEEITFDESVDIITTIMQEISYC